MKNYNAATNKESFNFAPKFNTNQVFTKVEELSLKGYALQASKMHYGLTRQMFASLAYKFAEVNDIQCPEGWEKEKCAGKEWLSTSFNRHNMIIFYNNLELVLNKEII